MVNLQALVQFRDFIDKYNNIIYNRLKVCVDVLFNFFFSGANLNMFLFRVNT